jgi:glycosyltransferase involved in cell wall biosynthesis
MVSIVIPAYNAEKTIVQTLKSVFAQTYRPIEVIVINDGSTDATAATISAMKEEITLVNIENSGVSYARNLGLSYAKGKYIQFLDSDDLLVADKLTIQVNALEDSVADVAYGNWQRFTQSGEEIIVNQTIEKEITAPAEIDLFTHFWCPPAVLLYTKEITNQLKWRENLPVIQDARYLLDAAIAHGKFIYVPTVLALYRDGQQHSLSQRSEAAFVRDCYVNCREIYDLWKKDFEVEPRKKQAIIEVLRFCINRLSVLDSRAGDEAIELLLAIEPNYIPKEQGILRILSRLAGYKNAEKIAALKRRLIK